MRWGGRDYVCGTAVTWRANYHPTRIRDEWIYGAPMDYNWTALDLSIRGKPVPMPLRLPEILHCLVWQRVRAFGMGDLRLLT